MSLKAFLTNFISLEPEQWQHLENAFQLEDIPAKYIITNFDQVEDKIYFVVKGVLRLYCLNAKLEDTTIFLFKENSFASSYESFLTATKSQQALESLEPCTLLSITKDSFDKLHQTIPQMNALTRTIADQRFINSQKVFMSMITRTPEQRYLDFEKEHADLLLRIPLNIIASFLGITPVSLSRIRARIHKK